MTPIRYQDLFILGCLFSALYGLGVPILFFCIMYYNREQIKHHEYTEKFGFLSTKMREDFYWCALTCARTLGVVFVS